MITSLVLTSMKVQALIEGDDPTTEEEYLARVISLNNQTLPTWSEVQIKRLDVEKEQALKALDEEFEKQVVELTGHKPNAERQMWMLINLSAKAFLAGDESNREFLEEQVPPMKKAELIASGEDVATWKANDAAKKEAITAQVVQMAMGMKKTAEEAIKAAETHEELAATIEALKAQEAATIQAFKDAIAAQQTP